MRLAWKSLALLAAAAALAGCEQTGILTSPPAAPQAPEPRLQSPEPLVKPGGQADYMAETAVKGDDETPGEGAVDIALEWSRKYAEATEELLQSRKDSKELTEENKKLLAQAARLQMQLDQSQQELGEANEMLVELGRELREWKSNVLGYRGEMLQAHQVQMEAIKKIMVLLGAEMAPPETAAGDKQAASSKDLASETSKRPNI